MKYTHKIYKILISRLQKTAYPQGGAASDSMPFSSNPDVPSNSQQNKQFDLGSDSKFCTKCNSKNIKKNDKGFICMDCNTRFSDSHFQFNNTDGSRQPGLLDLDHAGEKSHYHAGDPSPVSTSFSQSLGKG